MLRALVGLGLVLAVGCAGTPRRESALPTQVLLLPSEGPSLFLGAGPDAAQIGFVTHSVALEPTGAPQLGRVPVRIDGPLRARGYVAAERVGLRVLRRGRIRGTPVYVAPDNLVQLVGPDREPGRLRVRALPALAEQPSVPYEGSYPREGLAASAAPADALAPDPGTRYRVPAQTELTLFEAPLRARVATLAPAAQDYELRVLNTTPGWLAVRVGSGPFLIGWTQAALVPVPASEPQPAAPAEEPGLVRLTQAAGDAAVPARIARETGELRRVVAGAKITFGTQVIGVLKQQGWARVLHVYDAGMVDAFVAVDDGLALRGLVRSVDLLPAEPTPPAAGGASPDAQPAVSERSTGAAAR